jgi:DNA polymerase iota
VNPADSDRKADRERLCNRYKSPYTPFPRHRLKATKKQIVVTCNYEARRRGLRKLELIGEAKKKVPDLIIVLGEELGRFRDASKALYKFLEAFTWSGKVEKLGFDEVFMDVTDIIDYNQNLLNPNDLTCSFFCLDRNDPTIGFAFDATSIAGHAYPPQHSPLHSSSVIPNSHSDLTTRLILGSHFAQHVRLGLEEEMGYTSTVGISTNKLLSKLVGNVNKPKAQTTLLPPYEISQDDNDKHSETTLSNVTTFIDSHGIGKIPGVGFKMAQQIRNYVLSRPPQFGMGELWGSTTEPVTVRDVRLFPAMNAELLERILGGPGAERGIGGKVWGLINGIDNIEVQKAKKIPTQISIEDSYSRLDTMAQVLKELRLLATSLINRMHTDLLEDDEDDQESESKKRWIAYPKTVRLSTRPRPSLNDDGVRTRSFNRISRSGPLPNFVFSLNNGIDSIVEKLVQECLVPMFKRLHSQQGGWNLSLINIGVTNMVETASDESSAGGRDIGKMFRRQEDVLKEWKVEDSPVAPDPAPKGESKKEPSNGNHEAEPSAGSEASDSIMAGSEDTLYPTQESINEHEWEDDADADASREKCSVCGAVMPTFAMDAHERFHSLGE